MNQICQHNTDFISQHNSLKWKWHSLMADIAHFNGAIWLNIAGTLGNIVFVYRHNLSL